MSYLTGIRERMQVIGADGVKVGVVDRIEGSRIKLTRQSSGIGSHQGHHHYVPGILVAAVEGNTVRLAADASSAEFFEEEEDGQTWH